VLDSIAGGGENERLPVAVEMGGWVLAMGVGTCAGGGSGVSIQALRNGKGRG